MEEKRKNETPSNQGNSKACKTGNRQSKPARRRQAQPVSAMESVDLAEQIQKREAMRQSLEQVARSQGMLLALNQFSQNISRAHTIEGVYQAIQEQSSRLGYQTTGMELTADGKLRIVFTGYEPSLIRKAEKMTGFSHRDYQFFPRKGSVYQQVLFHAETVHLRDSAQAAAETLPAKMHTMARQIADIVGLAPTTFAPLIAGEETLGVLAFTGLDLTEADNPAITAFAGQAAIAMQNARLCEAAQKEIADRKQAEESLRKSEERYRLISNAASDYVFSTMVEEDGSLKLNWVAGAFETITGYTFEEYVAYGGWRAMLYPDDREIDDRDLQTLHKNQKVVSELRTLKKDGSVFWVRVYAHPIWDEQAQKLAGIYGAVQNVNEQKRAEVLLRESEERYRSLFDRMMDGVYRSTHEGKFVDVNPAMVKMFGYSSKEEMLEVDIKNELYFAPEERGSHILDTGQEEMDVYRMCRKDGSEIWVEDHGFYVHDEQGRIIYHEGMLRDITERKRAEEKLRESEEKVKAQVSFLNSVMEQSPFAMWISDKTGTVIRINRALRKFLNLTDEQILGKYNVLEDDNLNEQGVMPQVRAVFDEQKPARFSIPWAGFKAGDGDLKDARDLWIDVSIFPIEDGEGNLTSVVCQWVDISEQVRAEEVLRESEEKYRLLVENIPNVVWITDNDGVTTYISPIIDRIYGYTQDEIYKNPNLWFGRIHPDDVVKVKEAFESTLRGESTFNIEYRIQRKDGNWIWLDDKAMLIQEKDGEKFVQGVFEDITERVQAEEQLRRSEAALKKAQQVAHVGSWAWHIQENRLEWSDEMYRIFGIDKESFTGALNEVIARTIHPEDRAKVELSNLSAIDEKKPVPLEYRVLWPDGTVRLVWAEAGGLILDERGNLLTLTGIAQDITERKQAEEALAASEAELRALFASMQDVVLVIDREGVYREIAPTNPGLLYKPPQELLGQNLHDVFSAEQAETFVGVIHQTLKTGQTTRVEYELAIGEHSIWFSASISPMDADSTLWVARDITEQKQAETEIRRRADEFVVLYKTSMSLSAEHDSNTLLQTIVENAAIMLNAYAGGMYLYDPIREELEVTFTTDPSMPIGTRLRLGEGVAGRVAQTLQSMRIEDYSTWEGRSQKYEGKAVRATLEVPMLYKGELIGVLVAHETGASERQFTEADEHLLSLFAYQAAAAIQNARLLEQERQRVAELEMLYESGLALSRLSSPKEIGRKIIALLNQKMDWHHTTIRLYHPEDESLELLAFSQPGLRSEQEKNTVEEHFKRVIAKKGQGLCGWVIEHGQGVRTSDLINDARYIDTYPGLRSGLYIPIKSGERIIGVISIESEKENAFSAADERLTTTLANQAVSALENARLFEQERIRAHELSTLYETTKTISSDLALESVLETVAEKMAQILHSDGCTLSILNRERDALVTLVDYRTKHPVHAESKGVIYHLNKYPASRRVLESGQPLTINLKDKKSEQSELEYMTERGITTLLMLPLIAHDQVNGLLEVYEEETERVYKQEEIQLIQNLAAQAAISIENARLFEDAQRRLRQTKALREIDQAITGSMDMQHVLKIVLKHTISELGVDAAVILLYNPKEQSLHYELGSGFRADSLQFTHLRLGEGYAGRAALGKQTIYIPDLRIRNTDFLRSPTFHQEGFICYFGVPLIAKGEIMGVLEIFHRAALNPDIEWLSFMETLAGQVAIAIDNATLYKNLQHSNVELSLAYDATIEGWSRALDLRDRETEGHTLRVTELTKQMAGEMGMSEEELVHIRRGALLHDIGKMGVPDRILLKPDTLTDEEWKIMHKHPIFAYEMLSPIGFLLPALDIPYCHHEKWDGTGYPRKLKGDEIPLVARIFAVVDVWDALTSNRPYRPAWTKEQALEHIQEQSGKHFDPNVVKVFLRLIAEE